jgi:hypothetical protein
MREIVDYYMKIRSLSLVTKRTPTWKTGASQPYSTTAPVNPEKKSTIPLVLYEIGHLLEQEISSKAEGAAHYFESNILVRRA